MQSGKRRSGPLLTSSGYDLPTKTCRAQTQSNVLDVKILIFFPRPARSPSDIRTHPLACRHSRPAPPNFRLYFAGVLLLGYCAWLLPRQRLLGRDIAANSESLR
ncbi:hypothetical protein D9M73_195260 [compost metagenome]